MNGPPATWRAFVAEWTARSIVVAAVGAGIGAAVSWALSKAAGPTVAGGTGGAFIGLCIHMIYRVMTYGGPFPSRKETTSERRRWIAEREPFLRTAVVNQGCNPSGKRPEEYPAPYRSLIEGLANIAGEIGAAIRVVDYSDDSITIDTGPYYAESVRKELADRVARENRRLILHTKDVSPPVGSS